jgi:hypothetical protein
MSQPLPFRQSEVTCVIKALKAGGEIILGVERPPEGGFRVLTMAAQHEKPLSPLEAWEREHGDRAA